MAARVNGLLASFRVYLPSTATSGLRVRRRRYRFWDVRIFDSAPHLREFVSSSRFPGGAYMDCKKAAGFCRALHVLCRNGKWAARRGGRRGIVVFCLPVFGAGVVSHEWTHAAHYELTRHRGRTSLPMRDHEKLAWLQGEFVRRFWCAFYRRLQLRRGKWVTA